jgi:hypothetical protein
MWTTRGRRAGVNEITAVVALSIGSSQVGEVMFRAHGLLTAVLLPALFHEQSVS